MHNAGSGESSFSHGMDELGLGFSPVEAPGSSGSWDLELVASSGVRLRVGFVVAVVDFSHLRMKSQHQMVWGKTKKNLKITF